MQLIVSENFYDDAKNTAELYDKLFKKILDTRKETVKDNKGYLKKIFESFAYNIYKNNDQYTFIESKELEKNENEKLEAVLLFYMKKMKDNQQKEYYIEFVHRTFYQYFQAWYFYHLILKIVQEIHKIELEKTNKLDYISIILEDRDKITDLFKTGINMKNKVAVLFESISWRKIEIDVIDMIKQINQNQDKIQNQEQINYILDVFEKTDGIIKGKNNEWCIPIGQPNILDKIENITYNLLMILNIVVPYRLDLSKCKRIEQLIKTFDITDIYLPNVVLSGLKLNKINLELAHLEGAHLEGADLELAYLEDAHLEGADLRKVNLKRANSEGAHFERANLESAYLELAHLEGAHFEKANLTLVNMKGTHLELAHLEGAHLERAHLQKAHLELAHLEGADLKKTILEGANLEWTNLKGAYLEGANLKGANLKGAYFDPIILKNAILKNTKISKKTIIK